MIAKGRMKFGLMALAAMLAAPASHAMGYGHSWRPAETGMGPGTWGSAVQPARYYPSPAPAQRWRASAPGTPVAAPGGVAGYPPVRPRSAPAGAHYRPPVARQWQYARGLRSVPGPAMFARSPGRMDQRYRPMQMPRQHVQPMFTRQFGWRPAVQPWQVRPEPGFPRGQRFSGGYAPIPAQLKGQENRWRPVTAQAPWSAPVQASYSPPSLLRDRYSAMAAPLPRPAYGHWQPTRHMPSTQGWMGWQPGIMPYDALWSALPMMSAPFGLYPGQQPRMPGVPGSRDEVERFGRHLPDLGGDRREAWQRDCAWCLSGS